MDKSWAEAKAVRPWRARRIMCVVLAMFRSQREGMQKQKTTKNSVFRAILKGNSIHSAKMHEAWIEVRME